MFIIKCNKIKRRCKVNKARHTKRYQGTHFLFPVSHRKSKMISKTNHLILSVIKCITNPISNPHIIASISKGIMKHWMRKKTPLILILAEMRVNCMTLGIMINQTGKGIKLVCSQTSSSFNHTICTKIPWLSRSMGITRNWSSLKWLTTKLPPFLTSSQQTNTYLSQQATNNPVTPKILTSTGSSVLWNHRPHKIGSKSSLVTNLNHHHNKRYLNLTLKLNPTCFQTMKKVNGKLANNIITEKFLWIHPNPLLMTSNNTNFLNHLSESKSSANTAIILSTMQAMHMYWSKQGTLKFPKTLQKNQMKKMWLSIKTFQRSSIDWTNWWTSSPFKAFTLEKNTKTFPKKNRSPTLALLNWKWEEPIQSIKPNPWRSAQNLKRKTPKWTLTRKEKF